MRVADQKVDMKVTERDGVVDSLVSASFDMFNRGRCATLTTGFPNYSSGGYFVAGCFAGFDPTQFANVHPSSGSTTHQPTVPFGAIRVGRPGSVGTALRKRSNLPAIR